MSLDSVRRQRAVPAKVILLVGFCALGTAVLIAHQAPSTGYELSIYRATPITFWVGIGVAFLTSLAVTGLNRVKGRLRYAALGLAVGSSLSVASLPLLRGYYFYGSGDSLTHLGWAKDIADGALNPFNFLYPGVHVSGLLLHDAIGVPTRLGLMLTVSIYVLLTLIFIPLCVRAVVSSDGAFVIGTFAAALLLPINQLSVFLMVHPSSQGILFLPFVLYLTLRYLLSPRSETHRLSVTPTGVLLALSTTAILLIHPQQALNVIVVYVSFLAIQVLARWRWFADISHHRSMLLQTIYLVGAFLVWAANKPRTKNVSQTVLTNLLNGGPSTPGTVTTHAASVTALHGDFATLALKLLLPSAIFCVLAGVVMLVSLRGHSHDTLPAGSELTTYLTVLMGPLFVVFVVFTLATPGRQRFRYLGFDMVFVVILAAVGLTWGIRQLGQSRFPHSGWAAISLLFALLLPLCLGTYFLSPFIYQPNSQVTEQQMTGYSWIFAHQDHNIPLLGIHGGERRFADAIYGTNRVRTNQVDVPGLRSVVPPPVLATNLTSHYPTDRYLVVSRRNYAVEEQLYQGLRYPRGSIAGVKRTRGVDRVQSNRAIRLYYVRSLSSSS